MPNQFIGSVYWGGGGFDTTANYESSKKAFENPMHGDSGMKGRSILAWGHFSHWWALGLHRAEQPDVKLFAPDFKGTSSDQTLLICT